MNVGMNNIQVIAKRVSRGVESGDLHHLNPDIRELVIDDIITLTEMIENFGKGEPCKEDGLSSSPLG